MNKHRLQFRHHNNIWGTREEANVFLSQIVDASSKRVLADGSLYAEPLVTKYYDEDGNVQVIFAIGVDSGLTPYHIIDSKELAELIEANAQAIEEETIRAIAAEAALSASIETEIARAMEAEAFLSGAVDTEREERIAADDNLQQQISDNIAKIVLVTENLGANIREEYVLKNAIGEELGSHIKVYKDSALVGADVSYKGAVGVTQNEDGSFEFLYDGEADKENEYLYLIYRNEEGGLSLVALDFENFLMESEEGFGIKIVEHKITINIKENEKYLKVDETGLQTINIDEAIKNATDELNAKLDEEINRSKAADEYISGVTREFSASTVAEFISVNSALTVETERAIAAELHLSGAINTERDERIKKDDEIFAEIGAIKDFNNNLDKKIDVEITRSINEDENFRIQLDHVSSDINTEKINRENADNAIRQDFAAADIALGSRIDTVITDRDSADQFLSDRIDNEATTRKDADDLLTSTINGVSERVSFIESDYLTSDDKVNMLMAVSGAQNVAIEAKNAAASAQTTADEAKTKIDGFMAAAEIGGAAIDTLIEIQNYIKSDGTAAADMLESIAENKTAIETEVIRAKDAEKALDDAIKAEVSARTETANILSGALATEITRAIGAESVNATSIANEVTRATNVESSLQTALTTEITNRELADIAIRGDFAAADESLKNRIAAEELARQTAYDALNTRIDNEATTRAESVANLTSLINEGDKAVRESYEAADAVLQQAIQAETQNREAADAALQQAIQSETQNREAADVALQQAIQAETQNREVADSVLSESISKEVTTRSTEIQRVDASIASLLESINLETEQRKNEDAIINGNLVALSGNVLTEINTAKTEAINESFGKSSAYTDVEIAKAVENINSKKVNDVSYDNGNKKIYLTFADGTVSEGFDASEFVVDGMLNEVKFDENTNEITFKWNTTAGITDVIVPLNKFVDQYKVATDSVSYLKISDANEISAIVDNGDGFSNTLATTTFVTTSVNGAYDKINVVSGLVETTNNSIKELSGSVESSLAAETIERTTAINNLYTYVNSADSAIHTEVKLNTSAITILNSDKKTEGSVLYRIDNEIEKSMIYHGAPITTITPEDAQKLHSLIYQVTVDGEKKYYASSEAVDMYYIVPETKEAVNLNAYITELNNRILALEGKLKDFDGNLEKVVKDIMKSYLVGTENEIKISETDEKLKIGFDDNAIFGEI
jgi:hypothetical protein